ncbi:hypothetical protein NIES2119_31495 [[Phormidium ambiguum] IAM M-71]|uniref:Uncharacterized protein n=1 Tax=[Phormidium ambiguum] IAM M-71 TaxID=454136 RepID=A0A1U7I270_9CYAN|nr:hypothetical protein NIES2119_31495 [Phormidium ambiguum IAM M-71]
MSVKRLNYNPVFCTYLGEIKQKSAKTASNDLILALRKLIKSGKIVKKTISTNVLPGARSNQAELSNGQTLNCAAFTQLNNLGGR